MQTDARPLTFAHIRLQELPVGLELDASRYGTSRIPGCLPKFLRMRFFSVKE